jgi:3-hydroxyacyl-CoA dehydrogenase
LKTFNNDDASRRVTGIVLAIETLGVIGARTMDNGIAQHAAVAGIKVVMVDPHRRCACEGRRHAKGPPRAPRREQLEES